MKRIIFLTMILSMISTLGFKYPVLAKHEASDDLARLRDATERYHSLRAAQDAGYHLVPGLDYCFDNPGVGGMGFHYINTSMLDTELDPLKPEAMVYAPSQSGKLKLAAVEFIVPADLWNATHSSPPTLYGQTFGLEQALGVYELHAWIWKANPKGVFEEWNPKVSCK